MTTDEEPTTSTGSETASAEGQVAPETQETPPSAPAAEGAAPEPAPETQPSAEEELDKQVKAAVDAQFGEAAPEAPESDTVTLSKTELEEREKRAAQSAADRATEQVRRETQQRQQQEQARGRIRMDMRRDIEAHLKKVAETGEPSEAILDEINRRYGMSLFEEANEAVTTYTDNEAMQALAGIPGVIEAPPEDLAPLSRPFKEPRDKFAAMFEVAYNQGRKKGEADKADWADKEATKKARVATEAGIKRVLAEIRGKEKGGELPKGEATSGRLTEADIAKMSPDEWEANRERYYAQQGLSPKK